MIHYEHQLFINNEKSVQQELKDKGMTFIEVDKDAFSDGCSDALFNSLSPEMKKIYYQVQDMKKQRDEKTN